MENQQTKLNGDRIATIGLYLGIASIFLWEFSIIPILAIILGIVSLIRRKTKWKAIAAIVLGVIFLLLRISHGYIDRGFRNTPSNNDFFNTSAETQTFSAASKKTTEITSTVANHEPITNPEYLLNPSAYLVDYDNEITSNATGKKLWVESIGNYYTLTTSYIDEIAGEKILKIKSISIPWLPNKYPFCSSTSDYQIPSLGGKCNYVVGLSDCWKLGIKDYLQKNYLHSWIILINKFGPNDSIPSYIDTSGYYVLFTAGSHIDVAASIIKDGYGTTHMEWNRYKMLAEMNNNDSDYYNNLIKLEQVTSLAKRGLWQLCGSTGVEVQTITQFKQEHPNDKIWNDGE